MAIDSKPTDGKDAPLRRLGWIVVLCAAYCSTALLGFKLQAVAGVITPVWPPAGIALAALLLLGRWAWPGVALGALLANVLGGAPAPAAAGISLGNTVIPLAGAWALRRAGFRPALDRSVDVLLLALAAAGSTLLSASNGTLQAAAAGLVPAGQHAAAWLAWWLGDMMGILIFAPPLLAWGSPSAAVPRRGAREALGLWALLSLVTGWIFFGAGPRAFFLFPLLGWAGVRLGPRHASWMTLVVAALTIVGSTLGLGPYPGRLTVLLPFLGALTATSLLLSSLTAELHRAHEDVLELNRELERRVAERTEKLRAEAEERRRSEAQAAFQAYLLDNARDPIISMDARFRLTSWNKGAEQAYGWRREEVLGRPIADVMRSEFVGMSWWKAARTLLKTGRFQGELVQRRKDGEPIHVEASAIALTGQDGRVTGYVSVNRDITAHVHDREVTALKDREALLKEFLANVSHELRTPLAAILAFAQTLRQGGVEDVRNRIKFIRTIERHAINLSHLVDELLMISELQARGWPMKREEIRIADVLWEVINGIEVLAARKKIKLHADIPPDLTIWADRKSLARIFFNLLSNSVKYNKAGGSVHVEIVDSARRVLISVRDTGIGIPVAEIPRLFERYQKLENGEGRWSTGSGLGLSIVRGMVEAHGGKIWLTSVQGEGTTIYFTLPRRDPRRAASDRREPSGAGSIC